ncbi:cyclophilin-like fold protein [Aquamicrobium terrae]
MTNHPIRFSRRRVLVAMAGSILAPATSRAQNSSAQAQEGNAMRLRLTFADQDFTATLEDNPSARNLFSILPLDLTISDYSTNEKIAHLPRKLTEEGSGRFGNEAVGDLCYYAPWGNLAMFHDPYRWSRGLIRLGRLDGGPAPLLLRGEFPLRVEALS